MNTSMNLAQFSFHDSSLVGASHNGSTVVLNVEYFDDNDVEASVFATISGVQSITRSGVAIQEFSMETPDGEIYRLAQQDKEVTLIVFWHDCLQKSKTIQTYKMLGDEIYLKATKNISFNARD